MTFAPEPCELSCCLHLLKTCALYSKHNSKATPKRFSLMNQF